MATTVVKATEQVLVETATAVVSSLGAAATAEFKTLESGIAQEAVSATDDDVSNVLHKVEGAVEVVLGEVVNGVEHVVETVKQHPELIAEGALAVAIGVASLVQPELIAGEVAILGKMAADSAKKTVTQIASDEGQKIVKAISKDLADDAKVEAEKDKVQAEEKKKAEGGEVAVEGEAPKAPEITEAKAVAGGDKTIAIEIQNPAAKSEGGATDAKAEKEAAPVQLKITIGSDGEIKAVSKSVVEETKPVEQPVVEKTAAPVVAEKSQVPAPASQQTAAPATKALDSPKEIPAPAEPEKSIPATDSKPVEITEAPVPAKPTAVVSQPEQAPASTPVVKEISIPITEEAIPAKPESAPSKEVAEIPTEEPKEDVKAVELPVAKPAAKIEATIEPVQLVKAVEEVKPAEEVSVTPATVETNEVVQPEILAELGIVHKEVAEEPAKVVVPKKEEQGIATMEPEKSETTFVQQLLHRSNSGDPVVPVEQADKKETVSTPQPASVESVPEIEQEPAVIASTVVAPKKEEATAVLEKAAETIVQNESAQSQEIPAITKPEVPAPVEPSAQDTPEVKISSSEPSQPSPAINESSVPSAVSQAKDLAVSALESSSIETGPTVVTAVASVTNITKTTTKTVEVPSNSGVPMVTVSQESLDNLHSKLDAMHEAIQLITKTLATHLPAPPAPVPAVVKEVEIKIESEPATVAPPVAEPAAKEPETTTEVQPTPTSTPEAPAPLPATTTSTDSPTSPEATPTSPQSTVPKRPTHAKRGSVIGSIGKFLWPFGGTTAPPKDAIVQVSTVEINGEGEVQRAPSKDTAPGPELTKAASTVEVTEALATPVAV